MKFMFFTFAGFFVITGLGCGGSSAPKGKGVSPALRSESIKTWQAVRLVDLSEKPILTVGQTEDEEVTYIQIKTAEKTTTYQITDHQKQVTLQEVPSATLAVPAVEVVDQETFAKEVQQYLLFVRYSQVWRCRYSSAWRELASQDVREAGPLLLSIQSFRDHAHLWTWFVAIDQATFKVVGISGVREPRLENGNYYDSVVGENLLFGPPSEVTALYSSYSFLCSRAYAHEFVPPRLDTGFDGPKFISPAKEKNISAYMDTYADRSKSDPRVKEFAQVLASREFLDVSKFPSSVNQKTIDELIKIAREVKEVGL